MQELLALGDAEGERTAAIQRHTDTGLLERSGGNLRLTRQGLLLADTVLADLL